MKKIILLILLSFIIPNPKIKSLLLPGWGELSEGNKTREQQIKPKKSERETSIATMPPWIPNGSRTPSTSMPTLISRLATTAELLENTMTRLGLEEAAKAVRGCFHDLSLGSLAAT